MERHRHARINLGSAVRVNDARHTKKYSWLAPGSQTHILVVERTHLAMKKTCLFAGALACLLTAGCSQQPDSAPGNGATGKVKIGFLVKQPDEPWFQNEWKFAQQAADEKGFDLIKIGAADGSKVLAGLDNLGAQGAQGVIICAPDVRLGPAIVEKAKQYNMKVYAVDDQLLGPDGKPLDVPYMGISAYDIGKMVGKTLADEMKKRGWNVAEVGACAATFPELETGRRRISGATDALKEAGFPESQVYTSPNKTGDVPGAFSAANIILAQHSNIKKWLVFSTNDEGVLGSVRAMENRGIPAKDTIGVGIGGSTAKVDFEKTEPTGVFASVLINPREHGYTTSLQMYEWITTGKEPPKVTFTTGVLIHRDNYKQIMAEQGL